jgi:hypothetical protein
MPIPTILSGNNMIQNFIGYEAPKIIDVGIQLYRGQPP